MKSVQRPSKGLLAALTLALPCLVQAAPITINNYSFELPVVPQNASNPVNTGTAGFAWTTSGTVQVAGKTVLTTNGRTVPASFFDGVQALRLYTESIQPGSLAPVGKIVQTTSASLLSDTKYTLSINIAPMMSGAGVSQYAGFNVGLSAGADMVYNVLTTYDTGTSTWSISEISSGSNLLSASYSLTNGFAPSSGSFTTLTLVLTSKASIVGSDLLSVNVAAGNGNPGANTSTLFDNVQLDAVAVPEPSVVALMAFGGVAGLFLLRRKRNL